tara:strand:+ start:137 stop:322 length:186 start_codon:yes stop_codon:yes gene_type:complete
MKYNRQGNFCGTADELVETFARMNNEQRIDFCEGLSRKWPHLAHTIANMINQQQEVKEFDE